jgi:hypothetical protein
MNENLQPIHPAIQSLLISFTDEMKKEFGESLTSLILYGSAAGENFIQGKSNINLLMVLKEERFSHLQKYQKLSRYWKKKGIIPPLICTREFLVKSRDVFPIEWLEIISQHIILYGENPFNFSLDDQEIRRQCEKEIREIQIRIREAFLETGNTPREIERLALTSLNSVFPILRAVLKLQKVTPPVDREKLIEIFCKNNRLSPDLFLKIWAIKKGKPIPKEEYIRWFEDYLNQLEALSSLIDQIKVT